MRDPLTERWLRDRDLPFRFVPDFDLKLLPTKLEMTNPARHADKVNQEYVEHLAAVLKEYDDDTSKFPALVLHLNKDGSYSIVTGYNRRSAAKQRNVDRFDAYILSGLSEQVLERTGRTINNLHGDKQTDQENLTNALELITKYGYEPKHVALDLRLSVNRIVDHMKLSEGESRAHALIVADSWTKIGANTTKLRIIRNPLCRNNDRIFVHILKVAAAGKMTDKMVGDLLDDVKRKRSEDAQIAVIEECMKHVKEEAAAARRKGKRGDRQNSAIGTAYLSKARSLQKYIDPWDVKKLYVGSLPRQDLKPDIEIIDDLMMQLAQTGAALQRELEEYEANQQRQQEWREEANENIVVRTTPALPAPKSPGRGAAPLR